jgi:S1-C subfamily serine protease
VRVHIAAYKIIIVLVMAACLPSIAVAMTPGQVYESVKDSVVVVKAYDRQGELTGLGSGVMLPSGDIVTNYHVIKAGVRYMVGQGKKGLPANLKAGDPDKDLCLLTASGLEAKPARLSKAAGLKVGDPVYAVGAPQGVRAFPVGRYWFPIAGRPPIIQTTVAISPAPAAAVCSMRKGNWWALPPFT